LVFAFAFREALRPLHRDRIKPEVVLPGQALASSLIS
jgi:hypothetical protein